MSRTIQLHTGNQSLITLVASASTAITASYALSAPGGGLSGGTSNYIPLWTGTSTISSSNLYQNTSNVGIGTTTPATILDVNGGISIGAGKVISASANYTQLFRRDGNVGIYLGGGDPGNYYDNTSHYFRDASGATTRMIINSAGNVGIGTTSPPSTLTVLGNISSSANIDTRTVSGRALIQNSSGGIISLYSGSTSVGSIWAPAGGGGLYINDTNNYNIRFTAQAAALDTVFISSSGNVGIGTTSPANGKLHIYDNINGTFEALNLSNHYSAGTSGTAIKMGYTAAYYGVRMVTYHQPASYYPAELAFERGNGSGYSESMRIDRSGNVGIGTASPNSTLDVNGLLTTSGSTGISHGIRMARVGWASAFRLGAVSSSGDDFWITNNWNPQTNAQDSSEAGYITLAPKNELRTVITGTRITTVTSTGLGIGTTSPQSILDVITPTNGYASFGRALSVGQWSGIHFGYREENTSYRKSAIVFERTDNGGGGGNAAGKVHILNGPAVGGGSATLTDARLTIGETGNVGVGTASPVGKLHVQTAVSKSILISDASHTTLTSNLGSAITFSRPSDGSVDLAGIFSWNNGGLAIGARQGLVLATGGSSTYSSTVEAVRIDTSGNVGIGTTSPARKLDVIGNALIGQNSNSSTSARLDITAGGSGFNSFIDFGFYETFDAGCWHIGRSGSSGAFYISDYATTGNELNAVTITTARNVGIGTSSPATKLEVSDSNAIIRASGTSGTVPQLQLSSAGIVNWSLRSNAGAASDFTIYQDSTERVRISSTGNVGIGTNAPQYRLHVSGGLSLFNSSTVGSDGNSGIRIVSPIATTHYNWMVAAQQNVGAAFEITPSTAVGGTTFSSPTAVFTATGRVGIGTTAPMTKLTVNTKVTDDFSYVYDTNAVVATHQTATSTTTLNDPKEILVLARQGTSGQAYGAATSFQLSRYENNSTDSRTRLDLVLAHANYLGGPATVMTMRSDGKVGIGTTSPGSTLHIQGNVSASSYTSSISNGVGYFGTASYAVSASYAPGGSSQIGAESDQVILCVQIFS